MLSAVSKLLPSAGLRLLPEHSFVAFAVKRIARPAVLWRGKHFKGDPAQYAWCMPLQNEPSNTYLPQQQTALAERYGGDGVGVNGGGVRCGLLDGVQVKGIGQNTLVGAGAPYWHAYGGARLDECLQEIVWSEVIAAVLPNGCPRTLALIDVDTEIPLPDAWEGGRASVRRTLLLREPTYRLGHFAPCGNFNTPATMVCEADRVRVAVARFPAILAAQLGFAQMTLRDAGGHLPSLLQSLVDRLARQLAWSYTSRLVHGGLALSNLTLNGGWLDFGASTSIADYGPLITSGRWPPASNQAEFLATMIASFCASLAKFGAPLLPSCAQDMRALFLARYRRYESDGLLRLTGLPHQGLMRVVPADRAALVNAMRRVSKLGGSEPSKLLSNCPKFQSVMPSQMGLGNLNAAIWLCAQDSQVSAWKADFYASVPDRSLAEELLAAYRKVRDGALAEAADTAKERALAFVGANALRLNTVCACLHRDVLNRSIRDCIESKADIDSFVDQTSGEAIGLLSASETGEVNLSAILEVPAFASASAGLVVAGQSVTLSDLWARAQNKTLRQPAPSAYAPLDRRHSSLRVDGSPHVRPSQTDSLVGKCCELLASDQRGSLLTVQHLERVVRPAADHGQLHVFYGVDGEAVAYVAWAFIGQETERRAIIERAFVPDRSEWLEGESLWIVDLVARRGRLKHVMRELRDKVFADEPRVRYIRRRAATSIAKEIHRGQGGAFFARPGEVQLCRCGQVAAACWSNSPAQQTV